MPTAISEPPMPAELPVIDLPLQTRADVRLMPETADEEARTVELVWSSGAVVRRRHLWTGKAYDEVLSLEDGHVDLARLNGGAPLLNTHGAWDLADVIGVVERAWIDPEGDGLVGRARVRFSDREAVEPVWRDVMSGIIRNVSVGYSVRRYEITETDGAPPVWRAVDWQPLELSAVPVGADAAAGFRVRDLAATPCHLLRRAAAPQNEDETMPREAEIETAPPEATTAAPVVAETPEEAATQAEPTRAAPEAARGAAELVQTRATASPEAGRSPQVSEAEVRAAAERARAEERHRIATIQDAARKLGVAGGVADDLIARGAGLDVARASLIDAAAARDAAHETRPHVRVGGLDAAETQRAAVETALLHRYDPGRFALSEPAREWRGLSLIETARSWLEAEGVRVRGLAATRSRRARCTPPRTSPRSSPASPTRRCATPMRPRRAPIPPSPGAPPSPTSSWCTGCSSARRHSSSGSTRRASSSAAPSVRRRRPTASRPSAR